MQTKKILVAIRGTWRVPGWHRTLKKKKKQRNKPAAAGVTHDFMWPGGKCEIEMSIRFLSVDRRQRIGGHPALSYPLPEFWNIFSALQTTAWKVLPHSHFSFWLHHIVYFFSFAAPSLKDFHHYLASSLRHNPWALNTALNTARL